MVFSLCVCVCVSVYLYVVDRDVVFAMRACTDCGVQRAAICTPVAIKRTTSDYPLRDWRRSFTQLCDCKASGMGTTAHARTHCVEHRDLRFRFVCLHVSTHTALSQHKQPYLHTAVIVLPDFKKTPHTRKTDYARGASHHRRLGANSTSSGHPRKPAPSASPLLSTHVGCL